MPDTIMDSGRKSALSCGCDPGCKPHPHFCKAHHQQQDESIERLNRAIEREEAMKDTVPAIVSRHTSALTRALQEREEAAILGPATFEYNGVQLPTSGPKQPVLPTDPKARKQYPIWTGVFEYFPDALAAVAHVSWLGNQQHNPGEPLHWARGKSMDQLDTATRHLSEHGTIDTDGARHTAKAAWRILAELQLEIETERVRRTA